MAAFVHGGNVAEISREYGIDRNEILDFSANINPMGISSEVKKEMIKAIDKVEKYPDIIYYDLRKAIAAYEKVDEEKIVLGNGAAEVIFNVVRALKPKKVLLPAPTFAEYEEATLSIDASVSYYILREENCFNLDNGLIDEINEDVDMIFICNPNNPTGVLTKNTYIEEIAFKARKTSTYVVIDESFLDFLDNQEEYCAKNLLDKFQNIIIIKSLTKFFAMPGIRIGYGILGNEKVVKEINKISVPWNINVVAEEGIKKALVEIQYIKDSIDFINKEKKFLFEELKSISGIKVFKPSVNFVMFKSLIDVDIKEMLIKKNILIRSCNNYEGLNHRYYRVAVRTRKENEKLIKALKEIMNKF